MLPPLSPNENINSLVSEATPPQETVEPQTAPAETGGSSLHGEIGAEKMAPAPVKKDKDDDTPLVVKPIPTKKQTNIVDKSEGITKTHPVAPNADTLTTIADKDEETFIEGVEAAHHGH